jgi:shikimate kinase
MISFQTYLEEGINDPSIFKAVFLAGGPGSGKSFVVGKTALTALGMKVVNSDDAFENAMKKAGMEMDPENIFSVKGQEIRGKAKALTGKKQQLYITGRLGLVIDGTGKDYTKIKKQKDQLEKLGYETAMIFVNTDKQTALDRNNARDRSLPDKEVEAMWSQVQDNMGKFQGAFGNQFIIVDNSTGADIDQGTLRAYREIQRWSKAEPRNGVAQKWIKSQKK